MVVTTPVDEAAVEAAKEWFGHGTYPATAVERNRGDLARIITDAYAEWRQEIQDAKLDEESIELAVVARLTAERAVREKLVVIVKQIPCWCPTLLPDPQKCPKHAALAIAAKLNN